MNKSDKDRFVKLLYLCNCEEKIKYEDYKDVPLSEIPKTKKIVSIGAYCLMDNHFHILIKEIKEGGISKFMEKLSTAYVMYFNNLNDRSGALFESRFKAKHIDKDNYLRLLYCYIHFNPLKFIDSKWKTFSKLEIQKHIKFLKDYNYSSFNDYLEEEREECLILSATDFPDYFSDKSFEIHVNDWLYERFKIEKNLNLVR